MTLKIRLFTALAIGYFLVSMSTAAAPRPPITPTERGLIERATLVFRRAVETPAPAIPASVMRRALGVAIFPAATPEGGCYSGPGIFSTLDTGSPVWAVGILSISDAQVSVELDVDAGDLLLVAVTPVGLEHLRRADAVSSTIAIAPGPLGANPAAQTHADILAYLQFGDFFAGVPMRTFSVHALRSGLPLDGDTRPWHDAIAAYFRETS